MNILKEIVVVLYFTYFLALLVGYPEIPSITNEEKMEQELNLIAKELAPKKEIKNESDTKNLESISVNIDTVEKPILMEWQLGQLQRVWLQYQAQEALTDPLLIGDAKPEDLFHLLNRSLVKDTFLLGVNFFWCLVLGLYLLVHKQSYSFISSLTTVITGFSTLYFSLALTIYYATESQHPPTAFTPIHLRPLVETLLLMLSIIILAWHYYLISKSYSRQSLSKTESSPQSKAIFHRILDKRFSIPLPQVIKSWLRFFYHFGMISLFALLLANLLLLPLYTLQLAYPSSFAFCLIGFLLLATIYYAHAHWHTIHSTESKGEKTPATTGIVLLSYRLLYNMGFFVSALLVISLLGGIIVLLVLSNVDLIRNLY